MVYNLCFWMGEVLVPLEVMSSCGTRRHVFSCPKETCSCVIRNCLLSHKHRMWKATLFKSGRTINLRQAKSIHLLFYSMCFLTPIASFVWHLFGMVDLRAVWRTALPWLTRTHIFKMYFGRNDWAADAWLASNTCSFVLVWVQHKMINLANESLTPRDFT